MAVRTGIRKQWTWWCRIGGKYYVIRQCWLGCNIFWVLTPIDSIQVRATSNFQQYDFASELWKKKVKYCFANGQFSKHFFYFLTIPLRTRPSPATWSLSSFARVPLLLALMISVGHVLHLFNLKFLSKFQLVNGEHSNNTVSHRFGCLSLQFTFPACQCNYNRYIMLIPTFLLSKILVLQLSKLWLNYFQGSKMTLPTSPLSNAR